MSNNAPSFVRVVERPEGEAPEWVRQAWVGVVLPLARPNPITWWSVGVLSGPVSLLGRFWKVITGSAGRMTGYAVNARTAVDVLEAQDSAAAKWWRQNAAHLLVGNRNFLFNDEACDPFEQAKDVLCNRDG